MGRCTPPVVQGSLAAGHLVVIGTTRVFVAQRDNEAGNWHHISLPATEYFELLNEGLSPIPEWCDTSVNEIRRIVARRYRVKV